MATADFSMHVRPNDEVKGSHTLWAQKADDVYLTFSIEADDPNSTQPANKITLFLHNVEQIRAIAHAAVEALAEWERYNAGVGSLAAETLRS